jgi:heme-degrading monooxygenase HmoA
MVLELATIDIKHGTNAEFEQNLQQAQQVLARAEGYIGHQFQKCIERANRYILLIQWVSLEAHIGDAANVGTGGFRNSELFKEWRGLIGQFFENPPLVEHFDLKFEGNSKKI